MENEHSFRRRLLAFFTLKKIGGAVLIAVAFLVLIAVLRWDDGGDESANAAAGTPTVSAPTATARRATPTKEPTAAPTQTPVVIVVTATPEPTMVPTQTPVVIVVTATPEPTMVPTTAPTQAPEPTATMAPQATATPVPAQAGTGALPALPRDKSHDGWTISMSADIDNDPIVRDWLGRLKFPAPDLWETFPNIPNEEVPEFRVVNGNEVPDGMEYGVDNVPFCQQDRRCDFVVPAWHYRLITADYGFLNTECHGDGKKGCLLLLINVMDQSYTWRDQMADNGFTVAGRYWNGDTLEWGVWGLVSHASANMLNMPTQSRPGETLNSGNGTNGGANCGIPEGCGSVDVTVVVHAGERILAVAKATVTRP